MKRIWLILMCCFAPLSAEFISGEVPTTPLVWKVNIRRVSFLNEAGSWVTFIDEAFVMDIASINAGSVLGSIGVGSDIPSGTYSQMRFHIGYDFIVKGSVTNIGNGFAAYTNSENTSTVSSGGLSNIAIASVAAPGDANPDEMLCPIPTGANMEDGGMFTETIDGTPYFYGDMILPKTFTISEDDHNMPVINMNFDVTNTLRFFLASDSGPSSVVYCFTGEPVVTIVMN